MFGPEQQQAFRLTAIEMKRRRGEMSVRELSDFALRSLDEIAPYWSSVKRDAVSSRIATSISKRFDIVKARPAPLLSRGDRTRRDQQIVDFVISGDSRRTIQDVADEFGISTTTVHRTFVRYGLIEPSEKFAGKISPVALKILRLFEAEFPTAAYRLIALSDVSRALQVGAHDVVRATVEINALRQPLQIFQTHVPTRQGNSQWLIIQRGRGKTERDLRNWARPHLDALLQAKNSRIDARYIMQLKDPRLPLNPVMRDAAAVVMVSLHSDALRTWRAFIDASTVLEVSENESNFTTIGDPDALITAINGAVRLNSFEDLLDRLYLWPADERDRKAAKSIFSLAKWLRTDIFEEPIQAFTQWAEKTSYKERIAAGHLPGRTLSDFENLSFFEGFDDADELLEAFRRNGRLPVMPMFTSGGTDDGSVARVSLAPYVTSAWVHPSEVENAKGYIPSPDDED